MRKILWLISTLVFMNAFWACIESPKDEPHAGVDDFPNTVQALVRSSLQQGGDFNTLNTVPNTALTAISATSVDVPAVDSSKGLKKISVLSQDSSAIDLSHILQGYAIFSNKNEGLFFTRLDTAYVRWDSLAKDTIKNNEHYLRTKQIVISRAGKIETVELIDADGDGIINAIAGKTNKVHALFTVFEKDTVQKADLILGPGPDENFDTENDNQIYTVNWIKTYLGDTIGKAEYYDADNDGFAIDNGAPFSVVDVRFFEKNPRFKPLVESSTLEARLQIKYKDITQGMLRFSGIEKMRSGRIHSVLLLNKLGGLDLDWSDTLQAQLQISTPSNTDTLDNLKITYLLRKGKNLDDNKNDTLYAFDITTKNKIGEERESHFIFKSDLPIPSGQEPKQGSLNVQVTYSDSTSIELSGKLKTGEFSGTFRNRLGKRLKLFWKLIENKATQIMEVN